MPTMGSKLRAEQIELMAGIIHKERNQSNFIKSLNSLIDLESGKLVNDKLGTDQKAMLKDWRRQAQISLKLPSSFVSEFARLTSESMHVWAMARKENSFLTFAPYLEKIVSMLRKKSDLLGFKDHPYDALLDLYEPGFTTSEIKLLFGKIKKTTTSILLKIAQSKDVECSFLHGNFPKDKLLQFSHLLLESLGYDFDKGRLDLSQHPFSISLHPFDSRITTRIHNDSLFDCISAVLHEGGHSLYEMGLNPEHYGTPLCDAVSLGIHESQSRLWETRIGQSKPFWYHFLPILKTYFPELDPIDLNTFYQAINRVEPSFIRVEADEITYSLHVILRFEIEKQLIEGSLKVSEIPETWNYLMYNYLGIKPSTDAESCLQDIHWSMGAMGYFPTYVLGNVFASQFFEAFAKEHTDWEKRVAEGELGFLRKWLEKNIHSLGKTYSAKDLVKKMTGSSLSEKDYVTYLNKKYQELYGFA